MINEDTAQGQWKQLKGEIQKIWGNITGDELEKSKGDLKSIAGMIQERYGIAKEDASKKLSDLADRCSTSVKETIANTTEKAKETLEKKQSKDQQQH